MFFCISSRGSSSPSLSLLPRFLTRFLGYRANPPPKRPCCEICIWSFIGTFCGVALLQAVFGHARYFIEKGAPPIVASYGASAVLIYGAIEGPLAQPRNLVGGYFLGALTGVGVAKLFMLLPTEKMYQDLLWLSGSLVCACFVVIMQITGTSHPPAGAAALLAVVDPGVRDLGWYYLPIILLSSTLALAVALIVNNIRRCYPVCWFQPYPEEGITTSSPTPSFYSVKDTSPNTRVNSVEVLPKKETDYV